MKEIVSTIEINVTPSQLFSFMTDFEEYPKFDPGIEKVEIITPHKKGKGVKTLWTAVRDGQTKQWNEEVVEWKENEFYSYKVGKKEFPATHNISKTDNGSLLKYTNRFSDDMKNVEFVEKRMENFLTHVKKNAENLYK